MKGGDAIDRTVNVMNDFSIILDPPDEASISAQLVAIELDASRALSYVCWELAMLLVPLTNVSLAAANNLVEYSSGGGHV